jgi:DNA-binding response OmpR family regulator
MTGHCRPYTRAILSHTTVLPVDRTVAAPAADTAAGRVQVIADDLAAALPWARALAAEGLATQAHTWNVAVAQESPPDAWVLHVSRNLPAQLSRLRSLAERMPRRPLLVACHDLRDLDHVLALEMGADDAIDAGLGAPVVAARLRALWRRMMPAESASAPPDSLHFGALALHRHERRVLLRGQPVALTDGEFELLWRLAVQAGQIVARRQLVRELRGLDDERGDRAIDSRIYRIRRKLGDDQPSAQRIRTVRNRGYFFATSPW